MNPSAEPQRRIKEIESNISGVSREQEALLKTLPDKMQEKALLLRDLGMDRLELKNAWAGAEYRFLKLFKEIARRAQSTLEDLMAAYSFEDMQAVLQEGKLLKEQEISHRKKFFMFVSANGVKFHTGEEGLRTAKRIAPFHFEEEHATEFEGIAASQGTAEGPAQVIFAKGLADLQRDMNSFKKGSILVTGMTQPSMTPIIAKAKAIVADEGGITSHAAVLAREFGIPCVTGTHVCTKAIKTGDVIEVNGSTGKVKILHKFRD